jgi:VWFA-related protein
MHLRCTTPDPSSHGRRAPRFGVAWTGLLGCALAVAAHGQSRQPRGTTPDEAFEDRASVVEVQVPVNVVDKDGHAVRGLSAGDFQVLDNGVEQEIADFQVIDLELLEPDPRRPSLAEEAIPAAARRHFLFLFDLSFSQPANLLRARQAAQQFVIESMHPTDLAAVAIHSVERGPELIVTFTPDRAQLARAIDTLGSPLLLKKAAQDPLRFVIDTPDADGGLVTSDTEAARPIAELETMSTYLGVIGNQMARMEKSYYRGQISSWTGSMATMAKVLAAIEGRKHVVYFTEGFDGRLVLGRQPDKEDPEAERDYVNIQFGNFGMVDLDDTFGNTQLQNEIMVMLEGFRRADCIFQVVDISGIRADLPAEHRQRRVNDEVLFLIANETGGRLYEDDNDFRHQLGTVLERSDVTYVLTFRPKDIAFDGAHHQLRVRANAPRGARLSHRTGYYAPRPFGELHPLEKNLLASDLIAAAAPKSDLAVNVLAAPFRANEESAYVPVIIEVPGLDLLAEHRTEAMPVEFYAYVTDDRGEMRDFFTQLVTIDLRGRRELFERTGVKYYGHLDLRPGSYLVRVLARNSATGRTGVATAKVEVPPFTEQGPQLLPPFFVEEPGSWFLVREEASRYAKTRVYPFTVNGDPYVPSALPAIQPDRMADLCLVAYNFSRGDLEVASTVVRADGTPVEGGRLRLLERTITGIEGLDKLKATFEPAGLEAGEYQLRVSVTDPATRDTRSSAIAFRVAALGESL